MVQLVEPTEDRRGQPLLIPDLVLEGWWTSLDAGSVDAEQVILLYQRRGTSCTTGGSSFTASSRATWIWCACPRAIRQCTGCWPGARPTTSALHRPEHPHRPRCADPQGAAPAPVAHSDAGDDLPCGSPGVHGRPTCSVLAVATRIRAAGPLLCPRAGALRRRGFHQNTLMPRVAEKLGLKTQASAGFGVSDKERSPFWAGAVGIKTGEKGWESIISGKFRRNGVNVRGKSRIQVILKGET